MKASILMFFQYLGMIGVPVLLLVFALSTLAPVSGAARSVLLLLIAAGSVIYGAVGIREAFIHGGKKNEKAVGRKDQDH